MLKTAVVVLLIAGQTPGLFPLLPNDLCIVDSIQPASNELRNYSECPDYTIVYTDTGKHSRLPPKISVHHAELISEAIRRGLLIIVPTQESR